MLQRHKFAQEILFLIVILLYPSYGQSQSCANSRQCANGYCFNMQCAPKKTAGNACIRAEECTTGNCRDSRCAPNQTSGTSCVSGTQCSSGNCENSKCVAARTSGSTCTAHQQCEGGFCFNQKCTVKQNNGVSCTTGDQCVSGLCSQSRCASPEKLTRKCRATEGGAKLCEGAGGTCGQFQSSTLAGWFWGAGPPRLTKSPGRPVLRCCILWPAPPCVRLSPA